MTSYLFSTSVGQSIAFNPDSDVLNIGAAASALSFTETGGNTVVTVSGVGSVTLTGVTLGQLTSTNIDDITSGVVYIGDETTSTALDALGRDMTDVTTGDAIFFGMGGADTIDGSGTGNLVIYGGTGITDSTDGGDDIDATATGNVTVYGNAGNDLISLGATASGKSVSVWGGLDNDTVDGAAAAVAGSTTTIDLGAGNDAFTTAGNAGTLILAGGAGDDNLNLTGGTGVTGDATVYGGTGISDSTDGADTIVLDDHNAVVYANAGNDTVTIAGKASGTSSVHAGIGNDVIEDGTVLGSHTIYGGSGGDTFTLDDNAAGATSMVIYGGNGLSDSTDGADTIAYITGTATTSVAVYGNAGDDAITLTFNTNNDAKASVTVNGGLGDDTINVTTDGGIAAAGVDNITVTGGAGEDTFNFNISNTALDVVSLTDFNSTDDVLNVTVNGGGAFDTAAGLTVARSGSTVAITGATTNAVTLSNFSGNFTSTNFAVAGGTTRLLTNFDGAATTLTGGTGADQLIAGANGDTLIGSGGADKLLGGAGNDVFQFTAAQAAAFDGVAITITGGAGTDTIQITDAAVTLDDDDFDTNGTPAITQVEVVKLANFTGNSVTLGADAVLAGITTIDASALTGTNTSTLNASAFTSAVTYLGAAGVDTVTMGSGADNISTGAGDDSITIAFDELTSSDTISGGTGTDTLTLSNAGATIVDADFTNVTGIEVFTTNNGANSITLGTAATAAGIATINGGTAVDTINVTAMTSGVRINAGADADVITGGAGNDTIRGGAGNDTINLTAGGVDRILIESSANGTDTVTNFTAGSGGDIFDFATLGTTFASGVESIATGTIAALSAATGTTGVFVFTNDAVGNAAALETALDATAFDTTAVGNRIAVWEIDTTTVGIAVVSNTETDDDNDVSVTQIAQITGFADQTAVDAFTTALIAGNFDLLP